MRGEEEDGSSGRSERSTRKMPVVNGLQTDVVERPPPAWSQLHKTHYPSGDYGKVCSNGEEFLAHGGGDHGTENWCQANLHSNTEGNFRATRPASPTRLGEPRRLTPLASQAHASVADEAGAVGMPRDSVVLRKAMRTNSEPNSNEKWTIAAGKKPASWVQFRTSKSFGPSRPGDVQPEQRVPRRVLSADCRSKGKNSENNSSFRCATDEFSQLALSRSLSNSGQQTAGNATQRQEEPDLIFIEEVEWLKNGSVHHPVRGQSTAVGADVGVHPTATIAMTNNAPQRSSGLSYVAPQDNTIKHGFQSSQHSIGSPTGTIFYPPRMVSYPGLANVNNDSGMPVASVALASMTPVTSPPFVTSISLHPAPPGPHVSGTVQGASGLVPPEFATTVAPFRY